MIAVIANDKLHCTAYHIDEDKAYQIIGKADFDEVEEGLICKAIGHENKIAKSIDGYVDMLASIYEGETIQVMDDEQFSIFMS